MKKIYEATDLEKECRLDCDNGLRAWSKEHRNDMGVNVIMMITKLEKFPFDGMVDSTWSLNGIKENDRSEKCMIVFEPFVNHLSDPFSNIGADSTKFKEPIELSPRAIILMPIEKYYELAKDKEVKKKLKEFNIRTYEGEEYLACKMLMSDQYYVYIDIIDGEYVIDKTSVLDGERFYERFAEGVKKMNEELQEGKGIFYSPYDKEPEEIKRPQKGERIEAQTGDYRMITGLTYDVEGNAKLDDEMSVSTDIGKTRKNQEDAVLLIRDKENPDFKMMVVADGMGGLASGEVASDVIVNKLKKWFENLTEEQKACFSTGVEGLKDDLIETIELKVQPAVEGETWQNGGSTLVCAIIGKNDTLIANVGDSRAYKAKDGKLIQISREDTEAQSNLEKGKFPTKEASRFDYESCILQQFIGMDRRFLIQPYTQVISNDDYDLLMLFTDGVTDCLSDDDIAAVCRITDKSELASKIVEKAIRHDSLCPEEYDDYTGLTNYISGGKDNATAATYVPKKRKPKERGDE